MDWQDGRYGLQFNAHHTAYEEIEPITILDRQLFISDRDGDLATNIHASLLKLVRQAQFVGALQQSRTDCRMDLYGGADNGPPNVLLGHLRALCVSFASFALSTPLTPRISPPRPGASATSLRGAAGPSPSDAHKSPAGARRRGRSRRAAGCPPRPRRS